MRIFLLLFSFVFVQSSIASIQCPNQRVRSLQPVYGAIKGDAIINPNNKELTSNADVDALMASSEVILVGGLSGEFLDIVWKTFSMGQSAYLGHYEKFLQSFPSSKIRFIDQNRLGAQSVRKAAENIKKAIRESKRESVILISHSKGSADTLEALLQLQEENKLSKVKAWISLQGAVFGAPIADSAVEKNLSKSVLTKTPAIRKILDIIGIDSMRVEVRKKYIADNLFAIEKITAKFPVLSYVTTKKDTELSKLVKAYRLVTGWKSFPHQCGLGDGFVDIKEAIVPGSTLVLEHNIDHLESGLSVGSELNRAAILQHLLSVVANEISLDQ